MKTRLTEEQIIKAVTRSHNGEPAKSIVRDMGITAQTLYSWQKKYKNMTVNEAKRLRELEAENSKLKRIVADQALDIVMLKDVNSKKW